jgi:hypothetical protein
MRRKRFLSGLSVLFLVNIFALSVFGKGGQGSCRAEMIGRS